MGTDFRIEHDSMGEIKVSADRYWGAQAQRSLEHFDIGNELMPLDVIRAMGTLKKAAALTNHDIGKLNAEKTALIVRAADEVISGALNDHFPLHVWQTGSGTQTNMNVNEVISNRAIELSGGVMGSQMPVHPNNDVNMSQSSNDTFPTAMHIAAVESIKRQLLPQVRKMRDSLAVKKRRIQRHYQNRANPICRMRFDDAGAGVFRLRWRSWMPRLPASKRRCRNFTNWLSAELRSARVLNTHPEFAVRVAAHIATLTGEPFVSAPNKFAALASHDAVVSASGAIRTLACALMKIANDIRWLGSGPRAGIGELILPANEPGSSIMPGKVNPTQCEAMTMVASPGDRIGHGGGAGRQPGQFRTQCV